MSNSVPEVLIRYSFDWMWNIEWAGCRMNPYICVVLSRLVYITIDQHIVAFCYTVGWSNDVNAGASRLVTG